MRVLIVDDDPVLVKAVPPLLRREGHRVHVQLAAEDLTGLVADAETDLLILDPRIVSLDSLFKVCHTLRRDGTVMLLLVGRTASSGERASAPEAGADDYLSKPFHLDELLARVHALFRRHPLSLFGQGLGLVRLTEDLWLDLAGQRLVGRGRDEPLTGREFRLLACLVRHEGIVLDREALLQRVWGPGYECSSREIDVYIRYLRRKIEPEPARPRYIVSAWGRGYQYRRPEMKVKAS